MAPLTVAFLRTFKLFKVDYFALPNLLTGRELFPEFLQAQVRADLLGPALLEQLNARPDGDWYHACVKIHKDLARDASTQAASFILELLAS